MTSKTLPAIVLLLTFLFSTPPAQAADSCDLPELMHQQKDAAAFERLDNAWSAAFLRGHTQFLQCLLIP